MPVHFLSFHVIFCKMEIYDSRNGLKCPLSAKASISDITSGHRFWALSVEHLPSVMETDYYPRLSAVKSEESGRVEAENRNLDFSSIY